MLQSGKSFYLRTIAVLQVMAQIGCYVPASFAMIRICDQLFSRIGSDNSISNLESSFTIEVSLCVNVSDDCQQSIICIVYSINRVLFQGC